VEGSDNTARVQWDALVSLVLLPLQNAVDSKEKKMVEAALEVALVRRPHHQKPCRSPFHQKLIENGWINCQSEKGVVSVNKIVKLIENCFELSQKDENLQILILKVRSPLLYGRISLRLNWLVLQAYSTAVSSPVCGVHDSNLMTAVRLCYNIHLVSGENNRKIAKQTLTDMLKLLFGRMQSTAIQAGTAAAASSAAAAAATTTSTVDETPDEDELEKPSHEPTETTDAPSTEPTDAPPTETSDTSATEPTTMEGENPRPTMSSAPVPVAADPPATAEIPVKKPVAPKVDLSPAEIAYRDCFQTFRGLCKLSMKKIASTYRIVFDLTFH